MIEIGPGTPFASRPMPIVTEMRPKASLSSPLSREPTPAPQPPLEGNYDSADCIQLGNLRQEIKWLSERVAAWHQSAFRCSIRTSRNLRRQWQRISYSVSWSLTVGPSYSDSDDGFALNGGCDRNGEGKVTNLFIRIDRSTDSLESRQSAVEDDVSHWGARLKLASHALPSVRPPPRMTLKEMKTSQTKEINWWRRCRMSSILHFSREKMFEIILLFLCCCNFITILSWKTSRKRCGDWRY